MNYRLNRLLHPVSRRCFDVASDHGFFNEAAFLPGIEDIARVDVANVYGTELPSSCTTGSPSTPRSRSSPAKLRRRYSIFPVLPTAAP